MKFYIETERLILRDLIESDVESFFEMDSNPEVHKFVGNNPIKTIEQAKEGIANIQQQYIENGIGRWALIEKTTGDFLGWSGLKFIKDYENNHINFYDVGYRLMPKYWGKGYATESAKAALAYGFNVLKLPVIYGMAHVENKASIRALEKCGLRFIEKFDFPVWDVRCDWLEIKKGDWHE